MLKMLAYALKNSAEVNGHKVANIEIGSMGCEPEGSGLIDGGKQAIGWIHERSLRPDVYFGR